MIFLKTTHYFFLIIRHTHVFHFAIHDVRNLHLILAEDEVAYGYDANELFVLVSDKQVIDIGGLLLAVPLANAALGLNNSLVRAQHDEAVAHDATGGVLGVLQQILGRFSLGVIHVAQKALLVLLGNFAKHVGGILGRHEVEQGHQLGLREIFEQFRQQFLFHFRQGRGGGFNGKFLQIMPGLIHGQSLQPIGQIRRVQAHEFLKIDGGVFRHSKPCLSGGL